MTDQARGGGHTKGPWVAVWRSTSYMIRQEGAPDYQAAIAKITSPNVDYAANARLIAAAPDLLAALERLCADGKITGLDQQAGWDCWFAQANTAIAKAKGEA